MPDETPPDGLGESGEHLWTAVIGKYVLTPAEIQVLVQACYTTDELSRLETEVKALPELVAKGYAGQPKAHPLLNEIRAHRVLLQRLVESLNLPDDDQEVGLRSGGRHAQRASRARWSRLSG